MSVLVPTLLTRKRLRNGRIARGDASTPRVPQNLLLRALAAAVAGTVVIGGLAVFVLSSLGQGPLALGSVIALKTGYGARVVALVTPWALRAALAD